MDILKLLAQPDATAASDAGANPAQLGDPEHKVPLQHLSKSCYLNVGGMLPLPRDNSRWRPPTAKAVEAPALQQRPEPARGGALYDPFEGLPLRALADRLGEAMQPVAQAIKQDHVLAQKKLARAGRSTADVAGSTVPTVPSLFPITRWAASSEVVRATLIADDPKARKRARMSWYHPDDTMVPRDWFRGGLLEDLKYYSPFGWASKQETVLQG